jgi:hypothetical protein
MVGGSYLSEKFTENAIRCAVDLMEKETLYFTGRKKAIVRRKYLRLLKLCGKNCFLDEPVYIDRI